MIKKLKIIEVEKEGTFAGWLKDEELNLHNPELCKDIWIEKEV